MGVVAGLPCPAVVPLGGLVADKESFASFACRFALVRIDIAARKSDEVEVELKEETLDEGDPTGLTVTVTAMSSSSSSSSSEAHSRAYLGVAVVSWVTVDDARQDVSQRTSLVRAKKRLLEVLYGA